MARTFLFGLLVLLAAVTGCETVTEPGVESFEFFRDQSLEQTIRADAGVLIVEGTFQTPCIPYEIHSRVDTEDRTVTIHVLGEDADDNCPLDAIGALGYRAMLSGLEDGRWTVRVTHRWLDAAWPDEVVDEEEVVL